MLEPACPRCRGPLDATYDWNEIAVSQASIESGPFSLWRYGQLLPIAATGPQAGWTPLVEAPILAARLGLQELWLKLETAHTERDTRLRAVANAVATAYGLYPDRDWLRLASYAAEGAKTVAYEIAEQLGWKFPSCVIAPIATGRLLIKLGQGFDELERVELLTGRPPRLLGTRPTGTALDGMDAELAAATAQAANGKIIDVPPPNGIQALLQVTLDEVRTGAIGSSDTVVLVLAGEGPTTPQEVAQLIDRTDRLPW